MPVRLGLLFRPAYHIAHAYLATTTYCQKYAAVVDENEITIINRAYLVIAGPKTMTLNPRPILQHFECRSYASI